MQVKVAKEWRDVVLQQNKNQTMKERTNEKHLVYHRNKMTNLFFLLFLQQGTILHSVLLPEVPYLLVLWLPYLIISTCTPFQLLSYWHHNLIHCPSWFIWPILTCHPYRHHQQEHLLRLQYGHHHQQEITFLCLLLLCPQHAPISLRLVLLRHHYQQQLQIIGTKGVQVFFL